jgi:LacI family transcriptional regulator
MDDHPILEHTDPALTSIHMPMDEMGTLGAHMLLDVVAGRPLRHEVTATPPRLVVRRSTASPSR